SLNRIYRAQAPLWERDGDKTSFARLGGPDWDPDVLVFERRDAHGGRLVVVSNFSGAPRNGMRMHLPEAGVWREVPNTDALEYGGSGAGNLGIISVEEVDEGQPPTATVSLPALTTLWLRHQHEPRVRTWRA